MSDRADLHLHTIHSDGTLSPEELVKRARAGGLSTISVTDHDSVGAIEQARAVGEQLGVEVITGVELSVSVGEQDVHVLAYFFDHTNSTVQDHLEFYRFERVKRAERIVGKLNDLKVPLTIDAVLEKAGNGSVGRPHIANALVDEGFISSYNEAFLKYIGQGKPAFERKMRVSPRAAIDMISEAGGLTFLAHPGVNISEEVLMGLIKDGIDGIEVVHPSHSPERIAFYRGIVSEYFLLASGGSDYHGGGRNDNGSLGKYFISNQEVEMMRRRLDLV
ncbi:MAG: PHP domain-containing protein [Ignavibacteria bacterium]|nr:PHP domain-containing protein [Ignavibacteria bacterium]